MTNLTYISALPAATSVASADIVPVTQGSTGANTGTTRKATVAQMFATPPAMGGTTPNAGTFTNLTLSGAVFQQYNRTGTGPTLTPYFLSNQNWLGSYSSGSSFGNNFNCQDTLDAGAVNSFDFFYLGHVINAGFTGQRSTLRVLQQINGTPSDSPAKPQQYYVAANITSNAAVNLGGTAGAGNNRGSTIGLAIDSRISAGATYVGLVEACEMGAGLTTGTSASFCNVLKLSPMGLEDGGIGGGTFSYNGLALSCNVGDVGFKTGIAIGGAEATGWPIASTGTIIGATDPTGSPAKTAAYGVDFSLVTFSTAAFKSTGFQVNGSGDLTAAKLFSTVLQSSTTYANDAAASAGGVAVGQFYRNGSVVQIRIV